MLTPAERTQLHLLRADVEAMARILSGEPVCLEDFEGSIAETLRGQEGGEVLTLADAKAAFARTLREALARLDPPGDPKEEKR